MLKVLIKKQLYEFNAGYFNSRKTGKRRSKLGVAGIIGLSVLVFIFLGFMFYGLASFMCMTLHESGLDWLYFALMGLITLFLGIFGSVFNTYAGLYKAKDNELLLSLPVKPSEILLSRMFTVYLASLLYSSTVWIPTAIVYFLMAEPTALAVVNIVLLDFIISLLVSVLTCGLGWIVALISTKLKHKNILSVVISLAFFCGYYYFCFNMESVFTTIVENGAQFAGSVRSIVYPMYLLGLGASGDALSMALFTLFVFLLSALCLYILSRTFSKLTTSGSKEKKASYSTRQVRSSSMDKALFMRELKRFTSSTTYMLNCGLGIFILPLTLIVMIFKRGDILPMLQMLREELPGTNIDGFIPVVVTILSCLVLGMNAISTPSVSLEGKNLWIVRSLPVASKDILQAKERFHEAMNLFPAVVIPFVLCLLFGAGIAGAVTSALCCTMFVCVTACFGLMMGLLKPNLTWTSEVVPIKQSFAILLSIAFSGLLALAIGAGFFFLRNKIDADSYLILAMAAQVLIVRLLRRWLYTKGCRIFEAL